MSEVKSQKTSDEVNKRVQKLVSNIWRENSFIDWHKLLGHIKKGYKNSILEGGRKLNVNKVYRNSSSRGQNENYYMKSKKIFLDNSPNFSELPKIVS